MGKSKTPLSYLTFRRSGKLLARNVLHRPGGKWAQPGAVRIANTHWAVAVVFVLTRVSMNCPASPSPGPPASVSLRSPACGHSGGKEELLL